MVISCRHVCVDASWLVDLSMTGVAVVVALEHRLSSHEDHGLYPSTAGECCVALCESVSHSEHAPLIGGNAEEVDVSTN